MQSLNPSPRLSSKSHVHPGVRIRDRQERDHHPEGHRSPSCLPATGLDRQLYRRPRGLLALQAGRYDDAERELRQAVWTPVEGWGRTIVELANAKLAQGRPWDAVATLCMAYATRLDAMGRYVPISELDYRMAQAFTAAGAADSARVYADHVRRAWRDADPEFRRLLSKLPS